MKNRVLPILFGIILLFCKDRGFAGVVARMLFTKYIEENIDTSGIVAFKGEIYNCPFLLHNGYLVIAYKDNKPFMGFIPYRDEYGRVSARCWKYDLSLEENTIRMEYTIPIQSGGIMLFKEFEYPVLSNKDDSVIIEYKFRDFVKHIVVPSEWVSIYEKKETVEEKAKDVNKVGIINRDRTSEVVKVSIQPAELSAEVESFMRDIEKELGKKSYTSERSTEVELVQNKLHEDAILEQNCKIIDDFSEISGWIIEPWGDEGKIKLDNGKAILYFSTGAKGKVAFTKSFRERFQIDPSHIIIINIANPENITFNLAVGLFSGRRYYETSQCILSGGEYRVRFNMNANNFKTEETNWKYTASLEGPLNLDRITILIYPAISGSAIIDDIYVELQK